MLASCLGTADLPTDQIPLLSFSSPYASRFAGTVGPVLKVGSICAGRVHCLFGPADVGTCGRGVACADMRSALGPVGTLASNGEVAPNAVLARGLSGGENI